MPAPQILDMGGFWVLVDPQGRTRTQGRRELCEVMLTSFRRKDMPEQRLERLRFHRLTEPPRR